MTATTRARRAALLAFPFLYVLVLMPARPASAHQSGVSRIRLAYVGDEGSPRIDIAADIALDGLRHGYDIDLSSAPKAMIADRREELEALLLDRVSITDAAGAQWSVSVVDLSNSSVRGPTLHADLVASPPGTGISGEFDLRWDVVLDVVGQHEVFVEIGETIDEAQFVGLVTPGQPFRTVLQDVDTRSASTSMFSIGFEHFRAGADHLLFLCLLALGVARRRARLSETVRRLGALTVAFTVGHSASLAFAASDALRLPSRFVETAIAVTIVLAAVHAIRAVAPVRAEVAITLLFGFIHGFGFAGVLDELSLRGREMVVPLLTFNLGLEAAQLLALAVVIIQLLVVAASRRAAASLAAAVGVLAAAWAVERGLEVDNPFNRIVNVVFATPERFAAILALAAVALWSWSRLQNWSTSKAQERPWSDALPREGQAADRTPA